MQHCDVRILFVTPLYLPYVGGLEVLVAEVLAELRDRGHDVAVLTGHGPGQPPGDDVVDGVDVWRSAAHDVVQRQDLEGIIAVQRETWQRVRDFAPDVIHAHDAAPTLWLYLRAVRNRRPPLVMTLHTVVSAYYETSSGNVAGLRTMLRESDWVTGVSDAVVADTVALEPTIADRISTLPNGVRPPSRVPEPVRDGPARLLCLGRLVDHKGFDRALRAFARLAARDPDSRLVLVGDGPQRPELVALVAELGVSDRVDFVGQVDRAATTDQLDAATVVVMPSRLEGLPMVALEAAWMARPVVGTFVPGLTSVVHDGVTGTLVPGDDDRALADALTALIDDRDRARALGAAARALAEREFSLATCVDRYEALYTRVAHPRAE